MLKLAFRLRRRARHAVALAAPLFVAASAAACVASPMETRASNNPEIDVEVLFQHDGCTVYRFRDGSTHHYFARCVGPAATTTTTTMISPKKREDEEIPTVTTPRPAAE